MPTLQSKPLTLQAALDYLGFNEDEVLAWKDHGTYLNIVVKDGHAELPTGPGLSTRLLPELFREDHPGYRITRLK